MKATSLRGIPQRSTATHPGRDRCGGECGGGHTDAQWSTRPHSLSIHTCSDHTHTASHNAQLPPIYITTHTHRCLLAFSTEYTLGRNTSHFNTGCLDLKKGKKSAKNRYV